MFTPLSPFDTNSAGRCRRFAASTAIFYWTEENLDQSEHTVLVCYFLEKGLKI